MRSMGNAIGDAPAVRWLRTHPFVADLLLAVAIGAVSLLVFLNLEEEFTAESVEIPDRPLEWLLIVGASWAVPFRRVAPVPAVITGGVLQAAIWMMAFPDTVIPTAILIYTAAAHHSRSARRAGWAVAVALSLFTTAGAFDGSVPAYFVLLVAVFVFGAAMLGASARSRQQYAEAAEARAEELELSRQGDRERALVEERARIARELHDVVAHGLSVIVVQASAAQRILDRDPDGTKSSLQQIEKTGRNALNEMRQVLSAIRTDPKESWQPTPGLAALDDLVAELASTGLEVSVTGSAAPTAGFRDADQLEPLPATVDVTAYRIVQESLTNVLKHGGRGARATVDISRQPGSLVLRIIDNGRGSVATDHRDGQGLRGMRERVEVFGGRFDAGPMRGGGFAVSVSLPLDNVDVEID